MNKKVKEYILKHYKEYNLINAKCEPMQNEEDMLKLLNILEAHDENLDSLHDVAFNGYTEFCGIVGTFEDDIDTCKALYDFNVFFKNEDELFQFAKEQIESTYNEEDEMTAEKYLADEDIRKTSDGYVLVLYY